MLDPARVIATAVDELLPTGATVGGVIGALVAVFMFSVRVVLRVGDRSDQRYEAEITRVTADKDARIKQLEDERDGWRDRFLAIVHEAATDQEHRR